MKTSTAEEVSSTRDAEQPPQRGELHEALAVFLGRWKVEGTAYGSPDQPSDDPKSKGVAWVGTYEAHWYTGEFFVVHDERAKTGGQTFDTLSILGVNSRSGKYFARSVENHGFNRDYEVRHEGDTWWLTGPTERAKIQFRDGNRSQVITWEWKPHGQWLPLCDRVATRID